MRLTGRVLRGSFWAAFGLTDRVLRGRFWAAYGRLPPVRRKRLDAHALQVEPCVCFPCVTGEGRDLEKFDEYRRDCWECVCTPPCRPC